MAIPQTEGAAGAAEAAETVDAVLGGRVRLHQPAHGFRSAIDPVLLASSVAARAGERVLDVGCGVGTAALCVAARLTDVRVCGIERQRDMVALAVRNAQENGMGPRADFMAGDLLSPPPRLSAGSFDHVIANPPYVAAGRGNVPPDAGRAAASVEGDARLADWVAFAVRMARPKGSVTLIHRADRLDEVLAAMGGHLGDLVVFPLWPGAGKAAKRVIVSGRTRVAAPLRLAPGLVLHEADGTYTEAAQAILRDGAALAL